MIIKLLLTMTVGESVAISNKKPENNQDERMIIEEINDNI
jgi:hypothetical protein